MEAAARLLVAAEDDVGCPGGVEQHERDGQEAGDRMQRGHGAAAVLRHDGHQAGTRGVADQAEPEKRQMRALKLTRAALGEHADGVGDQRKGDDGRSGCKHGTHIQTSKIEWVCGQRPMGRSL